MDSRILIVDADRGSREALREALAYDGHAVAVAATTDEALANDSGFDVVIADVQLDLVERIQTRWPGAELVLTTCAAGLDLAIEAVRRGAFDFVMRPFFVEDVSLTVACAAARRRGVLCPLGFVRTFHDYTADCD